MRRCTRVTRSMQWVENEIRELPIYEVLPNIATFLSDLEGLVTDLQHLSVLNDVLKATFTKW